jgi:hypothetical protein
MQAGSQAARMEGPGRGGSPGGGRMVEVGADVGADVAALEAARAEFDKIDVNHSNTITLDEFVKWKAAQQAGKQRKVAPASAARFKGEAVVPLEKELEQLSRRISHQLSCISCLHFVFFLFVYVGAILSYPVQDYHAVERSMNAWVGAQRWGPSGSLVLADVASQDGFYQWMSEALVPGVWAANGTVMDFNAVLDGVYVGQKVGNFSDDCSALNAALGTPHAPFQQCPHWPNASLALPAAGAFDTVNSLLPGFSVLEQTDRRGFSFKLLATSTGGSSANGPRTPAPEDSALAALAALQNASWYAPGALEVLVVLVTRNHNADTWMTTQVRFVSDEVGGLQTDVFSRAFKLFPLDVDRGFTRQMLAWQFRVALEIIFCAHIVYFGAKQLARALIAGVAAATTPVRGPEGELRKLGAGGFLRGVAGYACCFWNLVDMLIVGLGAGVIAINAQVYMQVGDLQLALASGDWQSYLGRFLLVADTLAGQSLHNAVMLMVCTFRLCKLFAFHPRFGIVWRTVETASGKLADLGVVAAVLVAGYGTAGYMLFGSRARAWESPVRGWSEMTRFLSGAGAYHEFEELLASEKMSSLAHVPLSMFWYGFHLIFALVLVATLVAVLVETYRETARQVSAAALEEFSLRAELRWLSRSVARQCGCARRKPRSSRVDPLEAFLVPYDAESVRPGLTQVYNELSTVLALLKDPNEKGASAFVPFRRIERSPSLKVAVTYEDLNVLVRDPRIAMYVWAKYGPGLSSAESALLKQRQEWVQGGGERQAAALAAELDRQVELELKHQRERMAMISAKLDAVLFAVTNSNNNSGSGIGTSSSASLSLSSGDALKAQAASELSNLLSPTNRSSLAPSKRPAPLSPPALASPASPNQERQAIRLIESLLKNGPCPLQKIKDACAFAQPPVPWEKAKKVRHDLDILQCKDVVYVDGAEQVIRLWRRGTPEEVSQAMRRRASKSP